MVNKMKIDIKYKKIFITFLIYSIIGWCYEVFLEVFIYKWGFSNRGVLYGPYCPVYGFGALIFIFCFYKILKNKSKKENVMLIPIIFIGTALSATILELITSYLCELVLGSWPWQTYLDYKFNFEGRIALSPSIRFGIGGVKEKTQKEVADMMGISQSYISRLEKRIILRLRREISKYI